MKQIKICDGELDANIWLKKNKDKNIIDFKFQHSMTADYEFHFIVIMYEEKNRYI